ncbi:MAG: hypothetical protein ACRDGA_03585, partial [Bacteroidota bacterium]
MVIVRNSLLAILLFAFPGNPNINKEARVGYESITASDLKAHLTFLASSELEGRETTFRGQKIAALYIASVFQKLGLKPGGDNGTYFQRFDVEVLRPSDQSSISMATMQEKKTYRYKKDFISTLQQDTSVSGSVAFIGYADTNVDSTLLQKVAGKIVVAFLRPQTGQSDTAAPRRSRSVFRPAPNS